MRAVILACFFLSGASGLVLEMLWTRMLTLVFGSTTLAVSTVLTAFMGGLGLGSYLAGKFADRLKNPLRSYALAEAAVGLYALLVPWVISFYPGLNRWLWAAFGDRYALLSTLRFVASAGLLLVPTTLMGATLPLLSRHFVQHPWELRRVGFRIGTLYAVNLFGAVAGSFLAGFAFLPSIGLRWTNVTAASFNLTLAAAILLARRFIPNPAGRTTMDELLERAVSTGDAPADSLPPILNLPRAARRMALFAFCVSGATAMTLQVLWTRTLAVLIGSSIFSFTLILLAFLIGLGAGAAIFGRLSQRLPNPVAALAALHLSIAVAVGLSYLVTDHIPYVFAWLLESTSFGVDTILICQFVMACITVLPATVLMGGVFPLTMRIATGDLEHVGRDIGSAYAVNTIGAIVGSFLAGFVTLPVLGLQRGIYVATAGSLLLAAGLSAVAPGLAWRRRVAGAVTAVALAVVGLLLPRWDLVSFSSGFFRVSIARDYIHRRMDKKEWKTPKLVFYEDGVSTTVSVDQWGKAYSLKNNGKVDASNDGDMATQITVGLLPLLLYPGNDAPKVALVGYGSGVTAGAITQYPIKSLEVVELEPAIYRASHFFDNDNHRPLQNPKVTARIGDGRNFLGQRTDKFDVIVSQPSNPWLTGVSNLFTREYFRDIKRRLAPNGIFCQWAQLYEMAPWNIKTIYRTVRDEFPFVYVFSAEDLSSDTILIATTAPLKLDLDVVKRAFRDPTTRAEAHRGGLESPHDVLAYLLLGPEELEAFTAGAPDNTDDNARIEFGAPRDLLGYARFDPYLAKVYGPLWPYGRLTEVTAGLDGADHGVQAGLLARSLLGHGKAREAELWARRAEAAGPSPEAAQARLLLDLVSTRFDRDPEIALGPGETLQPPVVPAKLAATQKPLGDHIAVEYGDVVAAVGARRYATAYKILEKWPDLPPGSGGLGADFALLSGFLDYKAEFYADAIEELKPLGDDAAFVARRPELLYYLGRSYYASASYVKALDALERFVRSQRLLGRPLLPASAGAAGIVAATVPPTATRAR
ncbi:MAG TPA: fused MFS/spermidine synthase [Polyangia bacterium]|jgi:spermidine synthase|nr:fused MFS/spermidine synthase [Polyangia bacterium]